MWKKFLCYYTDFVGYICIEVGSFILELKKFPEDYDPTDDEIENNISYKIGSFFMNIGSDFYEKYYKEKKVLGWRKPVDIENWENE